MINLLMVLTNISIVTRIKGTFSFPNQLPPRKNQALSWPKVYLQEVSQIEYAEYLVSLSLSLRDWQGCQLAAYQQPQDWSPTQFELPTSFTTQIVWAWSILALTQRGRLEGSISFQTGCGKSWLRQSTTMWWVSHEASSSWNLHKVLSTSTPGAIPYFSESCASQHHRLPTSLLIVTCSNRLSILYKFPKRDVRYPNLGVEPKHPIGTLRPGCSHDTELVKGHFTHDWWLYGVETHSLSRHTSWTQPMPLAYLYKLAQHFVEYFIFYRYYIKG